MKLSKDEIATLRESFAELKPQLEDASVAFYKRLFAIAPDLETLFRADIENQGMRFMTAVGTILEQLENQGEAEDILKRLGEGHAAMGIKAEHFAPMRQALLETFAEILGDRFTTPRERAWGKAYDRIASGMISATKDT